MTSAWRDLEKVIGRKNLFFHSYISQGKEEINIGILDNKESEGEGSLKVELKDLAPLTLMLGVTGCGKSKGLVCILQQFLLLRQPFTLIDPTGSILRELVMFISELLCFAGVGAHHAQNTFERQVYLDWMRYLNEHLIILDFSGEFGEVEHCFNPLYCNPNRPREDPEFVVSCLMRSCARQFGSMDQMRRLLNVLGAAATIAAEEGESLLRIPELIGMGPGDFERVVNKLYDEARKKGERRPFSDYHIGIMNELVMPTQGRERRELVQSTRNLLNVFLSKRKVRNFINCKGSEPSAIDFCELINGDSKGGPAKTMLVHLPNSDLDFVKVMGNLIITRIEQQARLRTPAERKKRYFLVVDEMALTVDQGTAEAASIIRQLGLRMILAGQSSVQPPFGTSEEGKAIFNTLVSQAWMKILYRLDIEDARRFAPYIGLANGELEKKRFVEYTSNVGVSMGKQVTNKVGIELQQGLDVSQGFENTLQNSVGAAVTEAEQREERRGTDRSQAHSFEEHQSHTEGHEQRETEGTEASMHMSSTSGFAQENSSSQTNSQAMTNSNSTVKQDVQGEGGSSSREVQNREKGDNRTINQTRGENTSHNRTQTSGSTTVQKKGTETAHTRSFSQGTRQGVERREGETYQTAHVELSGHSMKREASLGEAYKQGATQKQSRSFKNGLDTANSEKSDYGMQVREVGGFHTLEQTLELFAQKLHLQVDRQCFVTQKPQEEFEEGKLQEGKLWVLQMQTHTVGNDFLSYYSQKDLVQSLLDAVNPSHPKQLPSPPSIHGDRKRPTETNISGSEPSSTLSSPPLSSDVSEDGNDSLSTRNDNNSDKNDLLPDELDL